MQILHISSDYPYTSVYRQLLMHFEPKGDISHVMYVPLPENQQVAQAHCRISSAAEVVYSNDFANIERVFYWPKVASIRKGIERRVCLSDVCVIHAHYLFSAGGVAYQIKTIYGIPYIVAVRSTDIDVFFRYGVHLRAYGLRILQNADKVVFISPVARQRLLGQYVPDSLRSAICLKSEIVPNGVDDFWLGNLYMKPARDDVRKRLRLLFVGQITKNKNIETIVKVSDMMNSNRGYDTHLSIIGDGPDLRRIVRMAQARGGQMEVHGKVTDKEDLMMAYRNADVFIMPSFSETFGLVYLEAMSQGLPVICSSGQGIDGYFAQGEVGYFCDPRTPADIADRVEDIVASHRTISERCVLAVREFSWREIADRYQRMYLSIRK